MQVIELWLFPGGGLRMTGPGMNDKLNADQARRLLTSLGLLATIRAKAPDSIYGLAQKLGVDPSNLRKELVLLARAGLLVLEKEKVNGRIRSVPRVKAEQIEIHLGTPAQERRKLRRRQEG
jgi:predicted transcriptional regulator